MDDNEIIGMYWKRDELAIENTRNKYGYRLSNLAYRMLRSYEDAEECESDTYYSAWNSMPNNWPNNLLAYLLAICRRKALSKIEYNRTKKRYAYIVDINVELEACICSDYEERLAREEIVYALNSFIGTLSKKKRSIFVLRFWFMYEEKEIAKRLRLSHNNVRTTLCRIKKELRTYLNKEGIV